MSGADAAGAAPDAAASVWTRARTSWASPRRVTSVRSATLTGNPQNMIIGGLSGISYLRFAAKLALAALLGLAIGYAVHAGLALPHRSLKTRGAGGEPQANANGENDRVPQWEPAHGSVGEKSGRDGCGDGAVLRRVADGRCGARRGGDTAPGPGEPEGVRSHRLEPAPHVRRAVRGREGVRGSRPRGERCGRVGRSGRSGLGGNAGLSAVLSNIVSNVPAVLLFKPVVEAMPEAVRETAWLALALSSTFAGNLTVLGSVANLIVVERARKEGVTIGFWDYCRVGIPLTLITLVKVRRRRGWPGSGTEEPSLRGAHHCSATLRPLTRAFIKCYSVAVRGSWHGTRNHLAAAHRRQPLWRTPSNPRKHPEPPAESRPAVLVVDDQPANLITLRAVLDGLGPHLVEARSGEEALARLDESEFAAILLDVNMPRLDGFETARLIRARAASRHTPIIFVTAFDTEPALVERAYALGAVDFLQKPLVPVIVRAKVASFVDLCEMAEQVRRQGEQIRRMEQREFELRLAEENARLREERERFRVTLASIGDAVVTTDADGRVGFLNPVAEALTGWTSAEAIGRPLPDVFQIINETTRAPVENPAQKALSEGVVVGLANHTVLIARDGTERPIDDSSAPIRDATGGTIGAVLVFRDVTERKRSEGAQAVLDRCGSGSGVLARLRDDPGGRGAAGGSRAGRLVQRVPRGREGAGARVAVARRSGQVEIGRGDAHRYPPDLNDAGRSGWCDPLRRADARPRRDRRHARRRSARPGSPRPVTRTRPAVGDDRAAGHARSEARCRHIRRCRVRPALRG